MEEKYLDSSSHIFLELYKSLVGVWFTTFKTELDIKYRETHLQVASKISNFGSKK